MTQKVREVMTPAPVALPEDVTLTRAARIMRDQGIGNVLVTASERLRGLVTDRDIVVRALAEDRDPAVTSLGEITSTDVATVGPEDDAAEAVRLMRARSVRRLPVVDDDQVVGIVSIGDLAVERDEGSALSDISATPPNN